MYGLSIRLPILRVLFISLLKKLKYSWHFKNYYKYGEKLTNEVTSYVEQVNLILHLGWKITD